MALNIGKGRVAICAHRGFTKRAPENSLESVLDAIEGGFDALEVDVRGTRDGALVLMHDEDVDRTIVGQGPVASFTLEEIQRLEFRRGRDFHLPTLDRVLREVGGKAVVYLDLRSDHVEPVVDQIRGHDAFDWTILHARGPEPILRAKRLDPRVSVHTFVRSSAEVEALLQRVKPVMVEVSRYPSPAFIDFLHERELLVELDAMGSPDFWGSSFGLTKGWRRCLSSGADFIMSDHPDRLLALAGPRRPRDASEG